MSTKRKQVVLSLKDEMEIIAQLKKDMDREQIRLTLFCYYCNFSAESKRVLRLHIRKCMGNFLFGCERNDLPITDLDCSLPQKQGVIGEQRKKHFCIFCKKLISNFSRHLTSKHSLERKVKEYIQLPKQHKRAMCAKIMAEGDVEYNNMHPENIIVLRRHKRPLGRDKCLNCGVLVSTKHILEHLKKCSPEATELNTPSNLRVLVEQERLSKRPEMCDMLKMQIFPYMKNDPIKKLCLCDDTLILYGNKLCERFAGEGREKYIRHNLRIAGRIAYETMKIDKDIKKVEEMFKPARYDYFAEAIKLISGAEKGKDGEYRAPSTPHQYGPKMKEVSEYLMTELLKKMNGDEDQSLKRRITSIRNWQRIYTKCFDKQLASLGRKQAERRTATTRVEGSPNNIYLFAKGQTYIEGTRVMTEFTTACGGKQSHLLTGTHLHKQMDATLQYLSLEDEDLRLVSEVMGHTEETHFLHYRKTDSALPVGRASKILIALDRGEMHHLKGKSLDEIDASVERDEEETEKLLTREAEGEPEDEAGRRGPAIPEPTKKKGRGNSDGNEEHSPSSRSCDEYYIDEDDILGSPLRQRKHAPRKMTRPRVKWGKDVKSVIRREFDHFINENKCPPTNFVISKMLNLIEQCPQLENQSPKQLKTMVMNLAKQKKPKTRAKLI